jgi:hypothetical protein
MMNYLMCYENPPLIPPFIKGGEGGISPFEKVNKTADRNVRPTYMQMQGDK